MVAGPFQERGVLSAWQGNEIIVLLAYMENLALPPNIERGLAESISPRRTPDFKALPP